MRFNSDNVQFVTPRTMNEIDESLLPAPAWPWPRSLPDWMLRDLNRRYGPDVRFVKGYIGGATQREPELLSGIGTIECRISYTPQTD